MRIIKKLVLSIATMSLLSGSLLSGTVGATASYNMRISFKMVNGSPVTSVQRYWSGSWHKCYASVCGKFVYLEDPALGFRPTSHATLLSGTKTYAHESPWYGYDIPLYNGTVELKTLYAKYHWQ